MGVLLNKATEVGGKTAHSITDAATGHEVQVVDLYHNPAHDLSVNRFLDTVGDGSGVTDFVGNYSVGGLGETIAMIKPAAGKIYHITRMMVMIKDTGALDADAYGAIGQALPTGIAIRMKNDSGIVNDMTNSHLIKTNTDWGVRCYDVTAHTYGQGDEVLLVRWTFEKSGTDLRLVGDDGCRLEVVFNDDMSFLTGHEFFVQGYEE